MALGLAYITAGDPLRFQQASTFILLAFISREHFVEKLLTLNP